MALIGGPLPLLSLLAGCVAVRRSFFVGGWWHFSIFVCGSIVDLGGG